MQLGSDCPGGRDTPIKRAAFRAGFRPNSSPTSGPEPLLVPGVPASRRPAAAAARSSCPQPPRRALPGLAASRASTPGPGPMYAQASGIDSVRQYATHTTRPTRHDTTRHDTTTILQWHHGIRFIHKYIVIPRVWGCQNPNRVTCFSGRHCGLEDTSRRRRFGAAHSSTTVHSTSSCGGPVPDPKPSR